MIITISFIIGIISGILTIIAFFFAKDVPKRIKHALLIVLAVAVLFSGGSLIGTGIRKLTPVEYLNISDGQWNKTEYRTACLGTDMILIFNYAEATATKGVVITSGL